MQQLSYLQINLTDIFPVTGYDMSGLGEPDPWEHDSVQSGWPAEHQLLASWHKGIACTGSCCPSFALQCP